MKKRRTLLLTVLALVLVAGLLVPFCWREWRLVRQAESSYPLAELSERILDSADGPVINLV